MNTDHQYLKYPTLNNEAFSFPCQKIICFGRTYAEHATELGNPVLKEPLVFIKPASCIQAFDNSIELPEQSIHYECELSLLIAKPLLSQDEPAQDIQSSIAGIGLGLDLTDRTLQSELKAKGHPWEKAKSFNGAAVISSFISTDLDVNELSFDFYIDNELNQQGHINQMILSPLKLVQLAQKYFDLYPGDIIMTGTPKGVGVLNKQSKLQATLCHHDKSLLSINCVTH